MNKSKMVVLGGLMACMAALFQTLPVFLTEAFAILTILSTLPVYVMCRINPKAGILVYIVSYMVINFVSVHEALFFIFTNGITGLVLGVSSYYTKKKLVVILLTTFIMVCSLSIVNFIIGIPVFGFPIPGAFIIQMLILLLFSLVYSSLCSLFCNFIFNKINKMIKTF